MIKLNIYMITKWIKCNKQPTNATDYWIQWDHKKDKKNSEKVKVSEINSINLTTKFSRTTAETFELLNVVNTQKESRVSLIQIKPENFVNLKKILDSDKKKGESKNVHTIENIEEPKKVSPIQIDFHPEDIELIPKNLQNKVTSSNQKGKEKL